ncbi:hypothetical protein LTR56_020934 [Elasticomyces elasticus]|nr:hypothetical protein LTR56_020934 [Elasticomyces elasticus]KAK3665214.1 hypothetical protein LTR22_004021 [Elasticomyces elasticus]KAK4909834.1 hypothetical protein LTR49_021432 [Elasticomyces elasticus]KAK5749725.1 hypothetical protein LTS12_020223 [Elasticomyces elasticus]
MTTLSRTSTANSTSTARYSQEPFETFQDKIVALSNVLRRSAIDDVRRMKGGSFNRVISARVTWSSGGASTAREKDVIFRIPRFPENIDNEVIQDQAAVLHLVRMHGILAPELLAFDATSANPISTPYTVQQYVHGTALDVLYDHMSLPEKLVIVDDLVQLLRKIEGIKFSAPGFLKCGPALKRLERWCFLDEQGPEEQWATEIHDLRRPSVVVPSSDDFQHSPLSFIQAQLDAWQAEVTKKEISFKQKLFGRLQQLCSEMQADARFHSHKPDYVLHHWDLEPRNLIVQRTQPTDPWRICGVLDWDGALSLPAVLGRQPPVWLWDATYSHSSLIRPDGIDGDADTLPLGHNCELKGGPSCVKEYFESSFAERVMRIDDATTSKRTYMDEAYGTGRWLRRLWRFARYGVNDQHDVERLERLELEWSQHISAI